MQPIVDLATGVEELRFEVVPGGHLGMLTGRAARSTTWRIIDQWIAEHATPEAPVRPVGRKPVAQQPTARKPAARKATRKAPAPKPRADAIGSNPARRYGSPSSRSLAAKK